MVKTRVNDPSFYGQFGFKTYDDWFDFLIENHIWGSAFSNKNELVNYIKKIKLRLKTLKACKDLNETWKEKTKILMKENKSMSKIINNKLKMETEPPPLPEKLYPPKKKKTKKIDKDLKKEKEHYKTSKLLKTLEKGIVKLFEDNLQKFTIEMQIKALVNKEYPNSDIEEKKSIISEIYLNSFLNFISSKIGKKITDLNQLDVKELDSNISELIKKYS